MAADRRVNQSNGKPKAPVRSVPEDQTDENIFLFVPNLIGYLRIVLALCSLYFMPLHPRRCSFLYSISCLLDALDGMAARKFQQSTRFGAVLDMVTDRCATACLLVFLSTAKPALSMIFQLLISLDFASHYMHMYATLVMGGQGQSHKNVSSKNRLMYLYYTNKWVLFVCCALNELFFIALYLLCFSSPIVTPSLLPANGTAGEPLSLLPGSPAVPRPSTFFASPFSAAAMEYARANKMSSTVPWILCAISAPVMAFKQFVNIVQLIEASRWLAEGDRKMRKQAGFDKKR